MLEALITLTLMSILLGVVASLMRDASILMREATADPLVGLQVALEPVCGDLRCAYKVTQCDSTAIELYRLDPRDTARLPDPIPSPAPASFALHGSNASLVLRYYVYQDSLWCDTTFPDTSTETVEVAPGVSAMAAGFLQPGLVGLSMSTQVPNSSPVQVVSLQTQVGLHLPPLVMP